MWALTYSGAYAWDHTFVNVNLLDMAVLMVAAMVV